MNTRQKRVDRIADLAHRTEVMEADVVELRRSLARLSIEVQSLTKRVTVVSVVMVILFAGKSVPWESVAKALGW